MEIPNKVYLEILPHSKPKEVYKDVIKFKRTREDDVEYVRADAFIEKACEWLKENVNKYLYNTGEKDEYIPTCSTKMIEDFAKYMEGE